MNMKKVGIWLDQKEAQIISVSETGVETNEIQSGIEDFHPKGGSKSKNPWGPVETVSEKKYLERNKNQEKEYFKNILNTIKGTEGVYLFGPAETKNRLADYLTEQTAFPIKVLGKATADSMTVNQKIAAVKSFFNIKSAIDF